MKRKEFGLEIKLEEGAQITSIQLSDETVEYLNSIWGEKTYIDYLKEFLVEEKNFEIANNAVMECMKDALPENIRENCKHCKGETKDESYKACTKYYLQMKGTFTMVGTEFVNIVLRHKHIYDNKYELQRLTINFFNCLNFVKGRGVMFIDLEKLSRYALDANFKSLSQLFRNSRVLKSLEIINNSLDSLNEQEMENKVLQREDENYIELQKEFFEKKQRFYKEKLFLQEKENNADVKIKEQNAPDKKISIPKYALYIHYLQAVGEHPYFENHPIGKLTAIEEWLEKEGIITTPKYFQIKYNFISNHKTNRIANNQVSNISYVAHTMLADFPKAKKLALSELKLAQTKNK